MEIKRIFFVCSVAFFKCDSIQNTLWCGIMRVEILHKLKKMLLRRTTRKRRAEKREKILIGKFSSAINPRRNDH